MQRLGCPNRIVSVNTSTFPDGLLPFADKRFPRDELTLTRPPKELADMLEREFEKRGLIVPTDELLEVNVESEEYPTASFLVQRDLDGCLLMMIPLAALRKPN